MFNDRPLAELRGPWGVPIQFGGTLLLLPLVFIDFGAGSLVLMYDLIFFAILLGSIFLHELGHAWGNLIQGVPVRRIMLYGGGGFCEPGRSATRYERELVVAMGPIVNLTLWALASLAAPMVSDPEISYVLWMVERINLYLALFNLIPMQPLDGGKLFELLLHRLLPPTAATRMAGFVGLVVAVLWIPAMIWSWLSFGLLLFLLPSIPLHWRMMRDGAA